MWTQGLARWYSRNGRHHLPWRQTRDPWAALVSEVMLQQTQVGRVLPKWEAFMRRWPTAEACSAADPADVLRLWQGLGYPRRAIALHRTARNVAANGWPRDEAGLRKLPGVGEYTARALLALAFERPARPPLDVNIRRVAARAAVGEEPEAASAAAVERAIVAGRPRNLSVRSYTFALFDAGALYCRAVARCDGCPLASGCAFRARAGPPVRRPGARRRQPRYQGSFRQLRGTLLAAVLDSPEDMAGAAARVAACLDPAPSGERVQAALQSLASDGLIAAQRTSVRAG